MGIGKIDATVNSMFSAAAAAGIVGMSKKIAR